MLDISINAVYIETKKSMRGIWMKNTKGVYRYKVTVSLSSSLEKAEDYISVLDDHSEEEWDGLTDEERESYLDEQGGYIKDNLVEWGIEPGGLSDAA